MGWVNEMNIGVEHGVLMILKHGAEYGMSMISKTWGEIWGGSLIKNMGQNMGRQYKEFFNHFFGFSSKRRL